MFRVVFYFHPLGKNHAHEATTLVSEALNTSEAVSELVVGLEDRLGSALTGWRRETHVPGVGWVNEDEAERAAEMVSWYPPAGAVFQRPAVA
jgi:hypothetical protein